MTRDEQLTAIARYIDRCVDLPLVPELAEGVLFQWLADRLGTVVPDWLLGVMCSASDGVSEDEAALGAEFVVQYVRHRLPAVLRELGVVDRVLQQIRGAVIALLLPGAAAGPAVDPGPTGATGDGRPLGSHAP